MQGTIKIYFFMCMFLFSSSVFANTESETENVVNDMLVMNKAKLRILNKQLGRVNTSTLDVGDSYQLDNLKITVYACYKSKEYDTPENTIFLTVKYIDTQYEQNNSDNEITMFSGWMFSSSPSLSAMEHPVYDIWLLSCEK